MKSNPNVDKEADTATFELSQMAQESLEIIKDMGIDYDDWIESSSTNEWTIRTLKLWYSLLGEQSSWAQWPAIFDDAEFMKNASQKIESEIPDLHGYLTKKPAEFKFDDFTVLIKVEALIKHLGGQSQVNPSADANDSSVGTFAMFVLRDALEFSGLIPEKKGGMQREFKLCSYKRQFFLKQLEQINDALD